MGTTHGRTLPATLLLGTATIVLGSWGYLTAVPGLGLTDALYGAVQLLGMDYDGPARPPWQLDVARYLGVLTLALAIVLVVGALARDRVERLRARRFARSHHVVAGLGQRGLRVAGALRQDGARLVAIADLGDPDGTSAARAEGITVVAGDPRRAGTYRDAAVQRAEHVLLVFGDDSVTLEALDACLAVGVGDGPTLHVVIDELSLWRELHRSALSWGGPGGAVEFVSVADRVAARLVEESGGHLACGRIVIWGSGPAAVRTAVHAVRWVLLDGGTPRLLLAGPHTEELAAELERSDPWVADVARTQVAVEPTDGGPAAAFVVGVPHADALAAASGLTHRLEHAAVVVEVPAATNLRALRRSGFPLDRIRLVPAEVEVLGPALFEDSAQELIARAKHADYLEQELRRGTPLGNDPSMRPWAELPDSLRNSNRRFADSIGRRLADLGARLEPLTGPVRPPDADPTLVEELARAEHARWMEDLVAAGWRHHAGEKDPERKLHPLLVDWDQLDEADRDKDRDAIRGIPRFLARVGYELRLDPPGRPREVQER